MKDNNRHDTPTNEGVCSSKTCARGGAVCPWKIVGPSLVNKSRRVEFTRNTSPS